METRYCIEYINPQHPLRDDGSLNVRYDRVLTLEQAEHDLTLILSFGGKILDLYMGNVVDGETGEWTPKPMIVDDDDDWFSDKWLNTLKAKTNEDNSLEEFKSLQHISKDLHRTLEDWGYAPNLYFFDGMWHVSWISCEEGDSIKDFEGNTPEEAIDKACNWFHSTFCNG